MKFSKTLLARTLLIHVYFWVVGGYIYDWLRCFDVTHCTCTYAHIHFVSRSHVVWMLHVYPGKTLMFSFCWAKSVVSAASDVITLLHSAYLLTLLAISIICFTCSFSYPLLRCHAVTHCLPVPWLSICISRFTRSFSYLMLRFTMLRCYDVMLLRCYAVTMFV